MILMLEDGTILLRRSDYRYQYDKDAFGIDGDIIYMPAQPMAYKDIADARIIVDAIREAIFKED